MESLWQDLTSDGVWVPVRAVPKERPQIGSRGAYYSQRYIDFRNSVVKHLLNANAKIVGIDFPVSVELMFKTHGFWIQIRRLTRPPLEQPSPGQTSSRTNNEREGHTPSSSFSMTSRTHGARRPKHVRGDIDNLCGGVLDALQDGGVLMDDKWVWEIHARIWEDDDDNS